MLRTITLAALSALGAAGPATAGSWGFGVGFGYGPPGFWGPPAVYYGRPVIVHRPPPGYYYEETPIIVAPPGAVYRTVGPDEVFAMLDAAGYRELSPMARRGGVYKLRAVDPGGNLVALEISIFSGAIEGVRVLQARYAAPPPSPPASAAVPPPRPKPARQAPAVVKPAAPTASAATPSPAPEPNASSGSAPAPLSDRLQPVPIGPEEPTGEAGDPLVVY